MNNRELIAELSKTTGKKTAETGQWLEAFVAVLGNTLSSGGAVAIPGFGVFEVKKKEERISVNPVSKKRFLVPPKLTPIFKPAAALKTEIKNIISNA